MRYRGIILLARRGRKVLLLHVAVVCVLVGVFDVYRLWVLWSMLWFVIVLNVLCQCIAGWLC